MTSPDVLVAGKPLLHSLDVERLEGHRGGEASMTWKRIGEAHHWNRDWSLQDWEAHLSRPDVTLYFLRMEREVIGMIELEAQSGDTVEIVTFGLLPEFIGQGMGGQALTVAVKLAWDLEHPGGGVTKRVWVHTNSLDHPHALRNYERRGFRVFRTDQLRRDIPG